MLNEICNIIYLIALIKWASIWVSICGWNGYHETVLSKSLLPFAFVPLIQQPNATKLILTKYIPLILLASNAPNVYIVSWIKVTIQNESWFSPVDSYEFQSTNFDENTQMISIRYDKISKTCDNKLPLFHKVKTVA